MKDNSQRPISSVYFQFILIIIVGSSVLFLRAVTVIPHLQSDRPSEQALRDTFSVTKRTTSRELGKPYLVVGYPKSGTTSVYQFFQCSGLKTQHFCCCGDSSDHPPCEGSTMAVCILKNMANNRTMLQDCGDYDVYCQLDGERPVKAFQDTPRGFRGVLLEDGSLELHRTADKLDRTWLYRHFLPQHFHLQRLHEENPEATFILPLREPEAWANSVFHWFEMRGRVVNEYIAFNHSVQRPGKQNAMEWLKRIYQEHTNYIRDFVQEHPSHVLVELNIADPDAGKRLAEVFHLDESCWGHHNKIGDRAKNIILKENV